MAHFYGIIQGNRKEATRCGSRVSGIDTIIKSWTHSVHASLYDRNDEDILIIDIPKGLKTFINGKEIDIESLEKYAHLLEQAKIEEDCL